MKWSRLWVYLLLVMFLVPSITDAAGKSLTQFTASIANSNMRAGESSKIIIQGGKEPYSVTITGSDGMRLRFAQKTGGSSLEPDPWHARNQPGSRGYAFIIEDDPIGTRTNINDNTSNLLNSYLIKANITGTYRVEVKDSAGAVASFNLRVN